MAAPVPMNRSPVAVPAAPRQIGKHRVFPRPQNDQAHDGSRRMTRSSNLSGGTMAMAPRSSTPHPIMNPQPWKHQLRRIGTGPDLPPTPPAHSNASSSSYSAVPSSPTSTENSARLPTVVASRPPATPPDQRGPPTPDVTPPHPASLARATRPSIKDRMASGSTVGPESRAGSFIAAREEATSSEDEAGRPAGWHGRVSTASQTTITRPANTTAANAATAATAATAYAARPSTPSERAPTTRGAESEGGDRTPKAKAKFTGPGGKQGPTPDAGHSRDARLSSVIMSQENQHHQQRRRRPSGAPRPVLHHDLVLEDKVSAAPTDATRAVRKMRLEEAAPVKAAPVTSPSKRHGDQRPARLVHSQVEATATRDARPSSTSTLSTSNVVEVLLVDGPPRRQRTLRHMRKQSTLRDAADSRQDAGLITPGAGFNEAPQPPKVTRSPKLESYDRESYVSAVTHSTNRSISSRTARREIWRSGAIPVVIVPDRRSSRGPKSREPSLRSTSSRHSDRAKSITSSAPAPAAAAASSSPANSGPVFERPARRSRAYSESDGSERTIDFPPTVPQRSSSLSAPTSRNGSRAGSFTTSSVKVHSAAVEQHQVDPHFSQEVRIICPSTPSLTRASLETGDLEREETFDSLGVDQHDDVLSVRKIPLRSTPFSVASMDTCATAPELSEALAVHMFPHQNSSVLMVDHSNRPSEVAPAERVSSPVKLTINSYEQMPVTPPQKRSSSLEVDSPLRNPRPPPPPPRQPPAINFIPATPSGMTPAAERVILQGNYFESMKEKPPRRPSIVRRAFSRRRHSIDYVPASRGVGFLARTFSLSRRNRDDSDISLYRDKDKPTEEDRLHPFWRPQWISDEDSEPMGDDDDDDDDYDDDDDDDGYEREDEVYRYPPVDNRPRRPRRSFSQKVKQTLSIFPSQEYHVDDVYGPQRRTIRRTSSGNLRIRLRQMISGPKEVRDGVGEIIRRGHGAVQNGTARRF
ncbi:hypothetical protein Trco_003067 [Trichoderma cornu-damae]|uniref:Uncharacterized protein n=1 Tax=Trichoderma cornu-damae TaxID=654480 RepID=A0A9P8QR63_9HYPO|nr:hypothetical protein Trco_003067 [Trichoderma cornu-damae]